MCPAPLILPYFIVMVPQSLGRANRGASQQAYLLTDCIITFVYSGTSTYGP
jgi:hypothetical protein